MTSCYNLIQVPLQFSAGVSSSGGIYCVKSRLFFDIILYLMTYKWGIFKTS